MPALQVANLTVRYENQPTPALEAVSFEVPENSISIVIGPNGSGKTTLFRAILGLIPHSGTIKIKKKAAKGKGTSYQFGYLPQRFPVDTNVPITVHEFLLLALVECSHSRKEQREMVAEVLSQVQAEALEGKLVRELSGGQLQRVLLARALVHSPNLLLLDEPEAGVDPGGEKTFYKLLKKLVAQNNITALIASHEMSLVRSYADQVICLNRRLVCAGSPEQALTNKALQELYDEELRPYGHHHKHA